MSMTEPPVPHEPPVLNRQPHIRVAKSSYGGGLLRKVNASIRSNWYQAFRLGAEKVERSCAFILDIGGLRRTWLRGTGNVEKRYLIQVPAHNLGLVIRHRFGAGTPRQAMAVLWFISPESCQVILATGAIHSPLEVADHDTIPPWKVVAFDCLIISI